MATTERDYYDVLGVARDASDADVKKAFRRLARDLHPDVSDAADAEPRFREVAEAYEVLSDPERRQTYDRFGHAGLRSGGFHPTDFDLGSLSDIFAAFFGDGIFGAAPTGNRPARGADVAATVEITLADVYSGRDVAVPATRRCDVRPVRRHRRRARDVPGHVPDLRWSGTGCSVSPRASSASSSEPRHAPTARASVGSSSTRAATAKEPGGCSSTARSTSRSRPGSTMGSASACSGEGHAGASGGPAGDLFVQVRVRGQNGLERDGDDLVAVVAVTMVDAALGTTVSVPTACR